MSAVNGVYGRDGDLPAMVCTDRSQHWYVANPKKGEIGQHAALQHRGSWHKTVDENGHPVLNSKGKPDITIITLDLPAVIKDNGDEYYYRMGKLHRDGGKPAVILACGTLRWFDNGNCTGFQLPGGVVEKMG